MLALTSIINYGQRHASVLTTPLKRRGIIMAKPASIKIRLNSSAGTGYFYVTKKNARTKTDKLRMNKYDPIARKHVEFVEGKIK